MARDHAEITLTMWGDDDWRRLTPAAQHLYLLLLTSPSLSFCGVADWRPSRIANLAGGWTVESVREAADELTDRRYLVIDEASEEVLIRSFIRHDGLMKKPNVAIAMATAHAGVASAHIRGVIVHELRRLHAEQPDLKGWGPEKVRAVLDRESIEPFGNPSANPSPNPSAKGSVNPDPNPSGNPCPTPSPAPTPTPAPSSNEEGNVSADAEPPREDVEKLCAHLRERLIGNGRKTHTTVTQGWRDAARLLLDRDKCPPAEAHALIDWCQDSEFWKGNINGMPKFRAQYDNLRLQAQQSKGGLRLAVADGKRSWTAAELEATLGPDLWRCPQPPRGLTPDEMWTWEQKTKAEHRADRVRQANEKLGIVA